MIDYSKVLPICYLKLYIYIIYIYLSCYPVIFAIYNFLSKKF